jgi:mRNA interferase HigB
MRVLARSTLRDFWRAHADSEQSLRAWYQEAERADWSSPGEVQRDYRTASVLPDNRVVFNIKGNDYRLVVKINYRYRVIYIRFVGTHAEYDRINAETI